VTTVFGIVIVTVVRVVERYTLKRDPTDDEEADQRSG
jgi:hypothetical protein